MALYLALPAAVPTLLIVSCVFQNAIIAAWVVPASTVAEVSLARALSFMITIALLVAATFSSFALQSRFAKQDKTLLLLCYLLLLIVAGGAAVGAVIGDLAGAATYARNMSLMPAGLALGIFCGRSSGIKSADGFKIAFCFLLIFGYLEILFRDAFLTMVGLDEFLLRTSERPDMIQYKLFQGFAQWFQAQESVLFNDPLFSQTGMKSVRLQGPTAHPISFGYALVMTSLPLLVRYPIATLFLQIPIQFGVGSKGALILLLICAAVSYAARPLLKLSRAGLWLMLGALWVPVTATALILGLSHNDYHVLGLLGGIKAFASNPFGHGVGTAGNLTQSVINGAVNWQALQHAGTADRGMESAIGVLIDQLGIFSAPFFLMGAVVIHGLVSLKTATGLVLATAAMGLFANGVLQEEALFSPSSVELLFFLAGVVLATPSSHSKEMIGLPEPV